MYGHQIQEDLFYIMLYGAVAMMSLMASCYLLFRRSNAIAPDITSSVRLRRWTAVFFACMTLSHLWYLPILFLTSNEEIMLSYLAGAILDFITLIPLAIVLLLVMLQDRRRPLWPVWVIVAPPIIGLAVGIASNSINILPLFYIYYLFLDIALIIYIVREVKRYGRWLRDNYADLEHKEVWQSFIVLAIILLVFGIYAFGVKDMTYHYLVQINDIVLICYLLWRVETLSNLSIPQSQSPAVDLIILVNQEDLVQQSEGENQSGIRQKEFTNNIGSLLQRYCINTQLYLQHDLTIIQLAKAIGTNRFYLSQYFSSLDMNYNAYINDLRISHFISLYREAKSSQRSFTAQQLAMESGYRSYNTFRDAFKRKMGHSVTVWMKSAGERDSLALDNAKEGNALHKGQEKV